LQEVKVAIVAVIDETTAGERSEGLTLEFLSEKVSVRELIRSRVYQEVTEHNARQALSPVPLVQPTCDELVLNGKGSSPEKRVNWERQFELVLRAFESNGFLLFAGATQLVELDEEIELCHDTKITFLRLIPLVGG
jgi:hypothetical protein